MTMDDQEQSRGGSRVFCIAVLAACLNGVAVGNLAGWPQAAIPQLLLPLAGFTEAETSWIAGIFFLGMLVGGFGSLAVAGRFGKRRLFLLASVPLILGWSVIAAAATFWQFVLGRIILGLGGGMMCHQTEMYLSEISPPRLRGNMSIVFCACVHLGVLLTFTIGPIISLSSATGVYLTVVLLLVGLYIFGAPETPFWLLRNGRGDEALESLRCLRGKRNVHQEFEGIVEFVERSVVAVKSDGMWTVLGRVLGDVANRKAITLVVLLTTAQQFSGMAAMHSYAQLTFERLGSSTLRGRYVSLLIGLIDLCCTLVSGCLIERVGRRPLVVTSTIVCATSMALLGFCFHGSLGAGSGVLPIVCIVTFALAYGLGLATMATVVAAECFSMDSRNLGVAVQNTTVCCSIFLITKLWQVIATSYGQEYSFWTAAIITGLHAIVLMIMLPETRGKSLTEIQRLLASPSSTLSELLPRVQNVRIMPAAQINKSVDIALR